MQIDSINIKKASLWAWCLFDFSNSIPAVIGGIYFSKWFIEDVGARSITFNLIFFLSTVVILFSGRWIGLQIDLHGYKLWIKLSSTITFLGIFLIFLESKFLPHKYLIPFTFISFLIFLFGYQISRICHNVYLSNVIPKDIQSRMSGFGAAANWAGSIVGILLTIPVITFYPNTMGRELTFFVAAMTFGVLTPISVYFMFLSKDSVQGVSVAEVRRLSMMRVFKSLGIVVFIYLLLFEVMATVQRNLPPFLSEVYKMSDSIQSVGFLVILIFAMIGGFVSAKVVTISNSSFWLKACSIGLAIAIFSTTIVIYPYLLWLAFISAGICYGMLESVIRIHFMQKFSLQNAGENFGVLAIIERTSGLIGPIIWIIPFTFLTNKAQANIASMFLMALTSLFAFVLLLKKTNTNYKDVV